MAGILRGGCMDKKVKIAIVMVLVYLVVFFIGFKSGSIYTRMKNEIAVEKIVLPDYPQYFIVETQEYGTSRVVTFNKADKNDVVIEMFMNAKLRHLLEMRDLKIFTSDGEQVYPV